MGDLLCDRLLLLIFEQCESGTASDLMQQRGLRALRRTRSPMGPTTTTLPRFNRRGTCSINQIKGSCAGFSWDLASELGEPGATDQNIVTGLEQAIRHHKFISLTGTDLSP